MVDRVSLVATLLVLAVTVPMPVDAAAQDAPPEPAVSAEEAIHLAILALDRLEVQHESDKLEALLDEANGYIDTVRTLDPGSPWIDYLYGRVLARIGRRGDAVGRLRKFVETREGRNEWRAFRLLGDLFVEEYPRLAKASYEKARALNPGAPEVLIGLSVCAAKLGATDEAISLAREAVARDGKQAVRYVSHLAGLFKAAGRWDEALREAERGLDIATADVEDRPGEERPLVVADAQYQLLIEILRARRAQADSDRNVGSAPGAARIADDCLRLASYIRKRDRVRHMLTLHDALRVLELGVKRTEPNAPPELLVRYGAALSEIGRTEAAIELFRRILAIHPDNAAATEQLKRLQPEPSPTVRPEEH